MPVLTPNHALLAAAAALAITAYSRHIPQNVIAALRGPDVPLPGGVRPADNGQVAPSSGTPGTWAPAPGGGVDFTQAGDAVIAAGAPGGGNDWLNWCLAWVNRTRTAMGLGKPALTAHDANAACDQLSLTQGIAPKGAIVCFRPTAANPDAHIGLSNGNNTYASAGLIHGGLVVADYLSNPNYRGYAT